MKNHRLSQAGILGLVMGLTSVGTAVADTYDAPIAKTPVLPPASPEPAVIVMAAVGLLLVGGYLLYRRRFLCGTKNHAR